MIKSFGDSKTERIWKGEFVSRLPNEMQRIARRKLRMVNNAESINDLRIPPANRLEKLKGELKNFHSIRINRQWRMTFKWIRNNAERVTIQDYHE